MSCIDYYISLQSQCNWMQFCFKNSVKEMKKTGDCLLHPDFISSALLSLNHLLCCGFAVNKFSLLFTGKLFISLSFLVIFFLFCLKNLEKSDQNAPLCVSHPDFLWLTFYCTCFALSFISLFSSPLLFRGSDLPLNSSVRFFVSVFVFFTSRDLFDSFSHLQSNLCSFNLPSKILMSFSCK